MGGPEVKRIGMLGGGVMGGGIAQVAAVAGYDVVVRDLDEQLLDKTRTTILDTKFGLRRGVEIGKIDAAELDAIVDRLRFTTDLRDLSDVDVLIEAVPERLELKQDVFAELDAIVQPAAIFATNTSGFAIADVAAKVSDQRRRRFAGMHFFSPVPAMKACEVIHMEATSPETVEAVRSLGERMGKVVVMVKDAPGTYGFIVNRVFGAAFREAEKIVADGIATREDIDKAMVYGRNWPVGFYSRGTRTGWID